MAFGVTQLFRSPPEWNKITLLISPLVGLALLLQSQDMAHSDPAGVRLSPSLPKSSPQDLAPFLLFTSAFTYFSHEHLSGPDPC